MTVKVAVDAKLFPGKGRRSRERTLNLIFAKLNFLPCETCKSLALDSSERNSQILPAINTYISMLLNMRDKQEFLKHLKSFSSENNEPGVLLVPLNSLGHVDQPKSVMLSSHI